MATLYLRPNAAGDETNLEHQYPDSDYHWDKVDEATPDEATTCIYTHSGTYLRDLYGLEDTAETGTINWIKVWMRCFSNGANQGRGKTAISTGGTVYDGSEEIVTWTWTDYSTQYTTNPKTEATWTWEELNALQAGVSLYVGFSYGAYCTQVYIEVDYIQVYELSCTDGLKAGDIPANIANMNNALTDGVKLSDSTVMGFFYLLTAVDGLKISDSALRDYIANPTLIDGVKLSESLSTWLQTYPVAIDGVKLSEILTTLKETFPTLTDGVKLSDAVAHYLTLILSASDGVLLGDVAAHYLTLSLLASDGVKLSDLTSIYKALVIYALLELYSRALIAKLHKRDTTVIQEE